MTTSPKKPSTTAVKDIQGEKKIKKQKAEHGVDKTMDLSAQFTDHEGSIPEKGFKLPEGSVTVLGDDLINIKLEKLKHLAEDQRSQMTSSDGCISNPGGPSC
ncbi:hypothetical protein IHE33_15060 (plasmid) [Mycetohabitans endofungorum]|uniref:hypothetical protein n=1 Tax=Mycetohabitans endofungorum TaxID=417203 RepID=UPI0030CD8F0A